MARRFLTKKTHRFHFVDTDGDRKSYVLILGDDRQALFNQIRPMITDL